MARRAGAARLPGGARAGDGALAHPDASSAAVTSAMRDVAHGREPPPTDGRSSYRDRRARDHPGALGREIGDHLGDGVGADPLGAVGVGHGLAVARRVHGARQHRVHRDAPLDLAGERLGEGDHAGLGHGIGDEAAERRHHRARGDIDDAPRARRRHRGEHGAAADHRRGEVERHHAVPVRERGREEIAPREAAHAVDEHVDPAVGVEHAPDEGAEARLVGHVGLGEVRRARAAGAIRFDSASRSAGTAKGTHATAPSARNRIVTDWPRAPVPPARTATAPSCGHARELLHAPGEVEVERGDPLGIVGDEVHRHPVVDIAPFRVVLQALGLEGGARHEAEGVHEVHEREFPVELAVGDGPAGQALHRSAISADSSGFGRDIGLSSRRPMPAGGAAMMAERWMSS